MSFLYRYRNTSSKSQSFFRTISFIAFTSSVSIRAAASSSTTSVMNPTPNTCASMTTSAVEATTKMVKSIENERSSKQSRQVKVGRDSVSPNLRIILIRHGESENNILYEISAEAYRNGRKADPLLTETGREQARETGAYLLKGDNALLRNIDEIYVSPLRRTLMTARPIVEALDIRPRIWTDIYEVGGVHENGIGKPGLTRQEIEREFPNYIIPEDSSITDSGWYDISRGKETQVMGKDRIESVYQTLRNEAIKATEDRTIALVVHGDFIEYFLQTAFNVKGTERVFLCWNTCISVIDINAHGNPMILMHNSYVHLSTVKTQLLGIC